MSELKYVLRIFKNDKYLYSVHCDPDSVEDLIDFHKSEGKSVKVVAYTPTCSAKIND